MKKPVSNLSELSIGERGVVERVTAPRSLSVRLMELGLVEGTTVRVMRKAPLGDPLELELRGYALSIRGDEAKCVLIRRAEP